MKIITPKLVFSLLIFITSLQVFAQEEGYDETYQLKKINNELKKNYKTNKNGYLYELMSIENDTLWVKKFSYTVPPKIRVWDELYVPMKKVDLKSIKYDRKKKGVLIKIKGKKKIIGDRTDKRPNAKKFYGIRIFPQGTEEENKEITEMVRTLFENHQ